MLDTGQSRFDHVQASEIDHDFFFFLLRSIAKFRPGLQIGFTEPAPIWILSDKSGFIKKPVLVPLRYVSN